MPRRRVLHDSTVMSLGFMTAPSAAPSRSTPRLTVDLGDGRTVTADLPAHAAEAVARAAETGEDLALLELGEELSTSEAATVLGMSRPTLIKLLDDGAIASRREGRDRRVQVAAVIAFKERRERMAAAREGFAQAAAEHPDLFAPARDDDDFDPSVMEPAG